MDRSLSELVDNLSELNAYNCEEPKNKNMQNKLIKRGNETLARTTCSTCNSKRDQSLAGLVKKFPRTYKLSKKMSISS